MPDQEELETYHGYAVEPEDQPQAGGVSNVDDRGLPEPLDEGFSPPEKYSAGQRHGNTPAEEAAGETLDERLAQEEPEPDATAAVRGESVGGEVGAARAGRLTHEDAESAIEAED